MSDAVYADAAATAPLRPEALEAMRPWLTEVFYNPSAVYTGAQAAREGLERARREMACALGAERDTVLFTSGGTEADNWALRAAVKLRADRGRHIVASPVEHHAVLRTLEALRGEGWEITWLPVTATGLVEPEAVKKALRPDTVLLTVMAANNEVGTLMPTAELGRLARERDILFHTDAVQAAGHITLDFQALNADLMAVSAHKFGGPRGVGALVVRRGLRLPPLLLGGGQERGLRSGTENTAGAVGMAAALAASVRDLPETEPRLRRLTRRITAAIAALPDCAATGEPERRLPGLASFVFGGLEAEKLLLALDRAGVMASAGSACASGEVEPSHVLRAMGVEHRRLRGALRLSLLPGATEADADRIIEAVTAVTARLRGVK